MPRLTRFHRLALCGGVAALFYLVGLGGPALWEPDEGRYAEVARAMVVSGDYMTPRNNGVRYFEKPPLVYWAGALAIRIIGRNEFAVRLPAALASTGSVVATAAAAETMYGPATGILAAVALGLSPLFFLFARTATPDPLLTFFFTAALFAFHAAARRDFRNGPGRRWMILVSALLAFATLAKGPVALLLAGAIALGWLIGEARAADLLRIRWAECVAVYLGIATPWFVLAAIHNPGFLSFFFLHEHIQRFTSATEHGWGPWFFVAVALAGGWPFAYFATLGMTNRQLPVDDIRSKEERAARRFLSLWFAIVLIFFSIPRSKLAEYLLPGMPPLAILAAAGLDRISRMTAGDARARLRWFAAVNGIFGVAGIIVGILLRRSGYGPIPRDGIVLMAIVGVAGLLAWVWEIPPRAVPAAIGVLALAIVGGLGKARSDATPLFSYRELARQIAPQLDQRCVLASYHHFVQALPFYTGHQEILVGYRGELAPFGDTPDAARAFIATDKGLQQTWASPSCMVLVANRIDCPKLATILQPAPVVVASQGKKVALTNQPMTAKASPKP